MKIPLSRIKIKKRIRRDLGDLKPLMESLNRYGLMNPIVINKKNELIAGHRRLESARRLGWQIIDASVVDKAGKMEKLELEIEENLHRKELSKSELADARALLEKLKNPGWFRRLLSKAAAFFKKFFAA